MPWRFIGFIVVFVIFLAFITLNLGNKCDINFGFTKFESVPVFLTIFISFILGFLSTLPFLINVRKRQKDRPIKEKKRGKKGVSPADGSVSSSEGDAQ
jgi:uncharacterized integral membrane protein